MERSKAALQNFWDKFKSKYTSRECLPKGDLTHYSKLLYPENVPVRDFSCYDVRVIVMKEDKPIFDSDRHQPQKESGQVNSDIAVYTELMFGAVGVKKKENQTKIHFIKSRNELLITKLFSPYRTLPPVCPLVEEKLMCRFVPVVEDLLCSNSFKSSSEQRIRSASLSLPHSGRDQTSPSPTHSGKSSPIAFSSSLVNTRKTAPGLVHRVAQPASEGSTSKPHLLKGPKMAIGVVLRISGNLDNTGQIVALRNLEDFVFSHFPLINLRIHALKMVIEGSRCSGKDKAHFLEDVSNAKYKLASELRTLYSARRIQKPVFQSLLRNPDNRRTVLASLVAELAGAVATLDTKDTDNFLSRLLTGVLQHHLGWIRSFCEIPGSETTECFTTETSHALSGTTHNLQMDQFWSLYGASNKPWKVCRTIICGQSEVDISRILYILTYFIRCKDLVKSTALVDGEDEDDFESPRPRQRLGAFSQSDFAHRLSLSPEPEPCMQFSFYHDLTATPNSTSYCSGCRGSLSSPLIPKDTCSASTSEHRTEASSKQNLNPEVVEIERSSDSGVGDPYKDDEASVPQRQTRKSTFVHTASMCWPQSFESSACNNSFSTRLDPEKSIPVYKLREGLNALCCKCRDSQQLQEKGYLLKDIKSHRYNPDHFSPHKLDPMDQQFSNSMFAGLSKDYMNDFVLHGTVVPADDFRMALLDNLMAMLDSAEEDGTANQASCVVADLSKWTCEVVSVWQVPMDSAVEYRCQPEPQQAAECIKSVLWTMRAMYEWGFPTEFCVVQLENMLKDICHKGELVAHFIAENSKKELAEILQDLNTVFSMSSSDQDLLLAIAAAQNKTIEQLMCSHGIGISGRPFSYCT